MMGNPYYDMLGLFPRRDVRLAFASLIDERDGTFEVEGRRVRPAGRAAGVTVSEQDRNGLFLCAGGDRGWFLLCRLEER